MLFNSYTFIFGFLPVVLIGFFQIGRTNREFALFWLAMASIFFYGWWNVKFVSLLLLSISFNYNIGKYIGLNKTKKNMLISAIVANLMLLAYFKYANFFLENFNSFTGNRFSLGEIILPLGISFFTFTQIAFLVDTYQGKVKEYNFVNYTLFVTYFPHLIAGPVLHHKEMMPQFAESNVSKINWENIAVGLTVFILGLAKKVLLADTFADFSTPIFEAVKSGGSPMLFEAWIGALSYSLQLYFDFSAYSDMAIGLSLMFNVRLPINFNSPYQATSIIDFWQRWHITLSRFLRDYLYIPLGGNRHGNTQRYLNLMLTMLLGGFWHGAGWTFIIWGGLHGSYLIINHAWRGLKQRQGWRNGGRGAIFFAKTLTFLAVVMGWVFFRAENFDMAMRVLNGMIGLNGCSFSDKLEVSRLGQFLKPFGTQFLGTTTLTEVKSGDAFSQLFMGLVIVFNLPNLSQIMANYRIALAATDIEKPRYVVWKPSLLNALIILIVGFLMLVNLYRPSPFLYFQF